VDREEFIAQLPRSARKTLAAIEFALGHQQSIAMSYDTLAGTYGILAGTYGIGRATLRYSLRVLQLTRLIQIGVGPNRVSRFELTDGWQDLNPDQVARKIPQARVPRPRQGRRKKLPATEPKSRGKDLPFDRDDPEPAPQYKVPGLARLRFMGEV
jgi:hypothetical protein